MSKAKNLISQTYALLCQELGDLTVKRSQIDKAIEEINLKISALNEFNSIAFKIEKEYETESKPIYPF